MTTIYLTRHGETDWNRDGRWQGHADQPLNELGRVQACELAERLASVPIEAVYSSDLLRAFETACLIAEPKALSIQTDSRLREIDHGSWSGLTGDEIEQRFPGSIARMLTERRKGWKAGEDYDEMAARVVAAIAAIGAAHAGERVLVVTHGGPLRAIEAHALGISFWEHRHSHPAKANCELSTIMVENGGFRRLD